MKKSLEFLAYKYVGGDGVESEIVQVWLPEEDGQWMYTGEKMSMLRAIEKFPLEKYKWESIDD